MELAAHLRRSKQALIDLAFLSEGRAIVLWIAFVVIFHETPGWLRFAPPDREASREDRFQLSGAEWTAEDDALLRSLIGSGKPPRAIARGPPSWAFGTTVLAIHPPTEGAGPGGRSGLFQFANQCGAGPALLGCLSGAGRI